MRSEELAPSALYEVVRDEKGCGRRFSGYLHFGVGLESTGKKVRPVIE